MNLAPSRRYSIAVAIKAAIDSGADLNMEELALALIEWRAQEPDKALRHQLDRILEQTHKEAA